MQQQRRRQNWRTRMLLRPCLIVAIVVIIVILVSVVPVVIRLRPPSPSSIVSVVEYGYLRYHEKARPST
ncbi:hypothetical protein CGGC5_v004152 [Colletotrichum fructicola Nara gc5]|uniref:Uncharacterized protein n=1 Tax=Colletotrichum fructicola (strain Nara gc5) TaxID=1213859 RepID=A0A7J6JDG2_COLFN|nr:hypothetical protein CGGC5_v004152 [Colletotrichum fructicola Nara gc5]KAF5503809.1 hypothetical protein CGCF413_v004633 [Colletotrichum fructicola]